METLPRMRQIRMNLFRACDNPLILAFTLSLVSLAIFSAPEPDHPPDRYDASQYLATALNIYNNGVFSEGDASITGPATGREPSYGFFLAAQMFLDKKLASITLSCLLSKDGCGKKHYGLSVFWNRVLIAASGFFIFLSAFHLSKNRLLPATVAGLYIWLNFESQKFVAYLISDSLAMFLSALLIWSIIWANSRNSWLWWSLPGFTLAALILTKAIFLYLILVFAPLAIVFGLTSKTRRQNILPAMLIFFLCCALPISAWVARNVAVDDFWGITEGRNQIAVSVREIYNDITFIEYCAGFVYWTRIKGDGLAHRLFPKETIGKLRHDTDDGFFRRGHQRVDELVYEHMTSDDVPYKAASDEVKNQILKKILGRPFKHLATTALLAYRGMWIDQFAPLGAFATLIILVTSARQRRYIVLLAITPGLFAFIFYPLISLNVPRYQMASLPALALTVGLVIPMIHRMVLQLYNRSRVRLDGRAHSRLNSHK